MAIHCLDDDFDWVTAAFVLLAAPLCVLLVMVFVTLMPMPRNLASRVRFMCFWLLLVLYLPVSTRSLSVFNCEKLDDGDDGGYSGYFMSHAPYVKCSGERYIVLALCSGLTVVFFVVGLPVTLLFLLWRRPPQLASPFKGRRRTQRDASLELPLLSDRDGSESVCTQDGELEQDDGGDDDDDDDGGDGVKNDVVFALLIHPLRRTSRKFFWWRPVAEEFGGKFAFALLVGLIHESSPMLEVAVFLLLFAAFLAHVWRRPWRSKIDNRLGALVLLAALVVYLLSIVGGVSSESGTSGSNLDVIRGLVSVVHVIVWGVIALVLWQSWKAFLKRKMRSRI